jgi:cytoskeletal protein CcmA (bactofilin family)
VTQVASGCRIEGKVTGKSNLRIDGEVIGTVEVDNDVTVASGGVVRGDVSANSVTIGGRIVGNVRGGSKVEILASGRLEGDVKAARVVLAEGAYFKGKVEMTGGQA